MSPFLFGSVKMNSLAGDVGLLILRVFSGGALALAHGVNKFPPSDGFIAGVAAMGFPMPIVFAWLSAFTEGAGGLMLAAGFATRPVALAICINMATAAFLRHAGQAFGEKELALLFMASAACFVFTGGGRLAVDRLIRK